MKIESIIRREGGSTVTLDGVTYMFKPDDSGRHVADIEDINHLGRLLEIREGYRVVEDDQANASADTSEPLAKAATLAPMDDQKDDDQAVDEKQDTESTADAADEDADNQDEQTEGEQTEEEGEADNQELDREALAVQFNEKFGRRPHNRWSAERIQQELQGE